MRNRQSQRLHQRLVLILVFMCSHRARGYRGKRKAADEVTFPGETPGYHRSAVQKQAVEHRRKKKEERKEREKIAALKGEEQHIALMKQHIEDLKKEYHQEQLIQHGKLQVSTNRKKENSQRKKETQAEIKMMTHAATLEMEKMDLAKKKRKRKGEKSQSVKKSDEVLKERRERANARKRGVKKRQQKKIEGFRNATIKRWLDSQNNENHSSKPVVSKAQAQWEQRQLRFLWCRDKTLAAKAKEHKVNCTKLLSGGMPRHPHSRAHSESALLLAHGKSKSHDNSDMVTFGQLPIPDFQDKSAIKDTKIYR